MAVQMKDRPPTPGPHPPITPPAEFVARHFHKQTWWVKAGWEGVVPEALTQTPLETSTLVSGGRGAVRRVELGACGTAIVRQYCRGGLLRHFVRDLYWDRPPRPFAELLCTAAARQRGVPTVDVLGAGVEWVTLGLYRGTLVTGEAEGCINLWEWLQKQSTGMAREAVIAATARVIAQLHDAGVAHADLNLTNILVRAAQDVPTVLVIDFDRASVFPGPLPAAKRERNLRRLRRSLDKLDPGGLLCSPMDLKTFCRAYHSH